MAEQFLEEIYEKSLMIFELKCIQENCYKHREIKQHILRIRDSLGSIANEIAKINYMQGKNLIKSVQETVDSIIQGKRGDQLELVAIPILYDIIEKYGLIKELNMEGDYEFISSKSGFLTLRNTERDLYYHSLIDPMWEARKLAEDIYDERFSEYTLRGVGLGYLPYQLYQLSGGSVVINIFENDCRLVEYAKKYGVLDWIPAEDLRITIDDDIMSFLVSMDKKNGGYYFPDYELQNIPNDCIITMTEIVSQQITQRMYEKDFIQNFYRNIESGIKSINDLNRDSVKKECIVVAAGPSLDQNIGFIRTNQGKKTIIAIGAVYKKLLKENITPDFVVIYDSQEIVYEQIKGIEDQKIPLLIGSFTYWKIGKKYKGEKYIIPIIVQNERVKDYALKNNLELWDSGATVTYTAIDFAVRFGALEVSLVGVDLCFPDGISHATGVNNRDKISIENLISIEGVNGKEVYTDIGFYTFLENIESLIENYQKVKFYNMSRIGARIKGCIE